jgi:hypothetical protein
MISMGCLSAPPGLNFLAPLVRCGYFEYPLDFRTIFHSHRTP